MNEAVGGASALGIGNLAGGGSSASISASGAVAAVGETFNYTGPITWISAPPNGFTPITVGAITQSAEKERTVSNNATGGATTTLGVAAISGDGASASIGATGAATSVAHTNMYSNVWGYTVGAVNQTATNAGGAASPVMNNGTITATGGLTGMGSSASVSAAGAAASFSVASIGDGALPTSTTVSSITQTVANGANAGSNVTNERRRDQPRRRLRQWGKRVHRGHRRRRVLPHGPLAKSYDI